MKDTTDAKTIDMHGEAKKRGRPVTGQAMTPAERKRAQRKREMKKVLEFNEDLTKISDSGLIDLMANSVLRPSIGQIVWQEWGRRHGFNA